jgi:hypothetical protein
MCQHLFWARCWYLQIAKSASTSIHHPWLRRGTLCALPRAVSGPPAVGGVTGASRPPVCRSLSAARHRAVVKDPPERSLTPWRGASRFPKWQVLYGRLWRTRAARSAISGRVVRLMSLGTCLGVFVCRGIGAGFLVFVMCVHRETQSFGSSSTGKKNSTLGEVITKTRCCVPKMVIWVRPHIALLRKPQASAVLC